MAAIEKCTAENPCVTMQLLTQRIINQEERIDKMENLMESMRTRLPLWATMMFSACAGAIGILVGLILKG